MNTAAPSIGERLRDWRQRRRLSQLDLALDAEISNRHLSFVETGRAAPSREMVLRLAAKLDVPLRERNALLLAAGFAPAYPERGLGDDELAGAKRAMETLLAVHEPFPALAVDRHWTLFAANQGALRRMQAVAPHLLEPPAIVLRLSLHPEAVAPHIENLGEWKAHLLHRLRQQVEASRDRALQTLIAEMEGYPAPPAPQRWTPGGLAVPLSLRIGSERMSLLSATMLFGTPLDVALSEIAVELFLPADEQTDARFRDRAAPE